MAEGRAAYERGDNAAAERIWLPLAGAGNAAAEIALGDLYLIGRAAGPGEPGRDAGQGYADAVEWYRKAADQNAADAHIRLGEMYRYGLGATADLGEAVRRLQRASELGNQAAEALLAGLDGTVITLAAAGDHAAALAIWRRLAEGGDPTIEYNAARSLLLGNGVRQGPDEALGWLRKSADLGNPRARYLIETFYGSNARIPRATISRRPPGCATRQLSSSAALTPSAAATFKTR